VDRRLFLPDAWIENQQSWFSFGETRCNKAGIPKQHQVKKTRHQQALAEYLGLPPAKRINGRGKKLPHKWIAGDDEMGKVPWFRRDLRDQNEPYMFAVPSNILICDLDAPDQYCGTCGKELERKFVNVCVWMKNTPANKWKTTKVREGHKGWLTVKLTSCRVRAKIENEVGDEETLIVSQWREDNGKPRCDYQQFWFAFGPPL